MKKYFNFTLLTLAAAMLFTACSNEEEIANGGTPNIEGGITFTFPAPKAGTTYATVGSAVENSIDLTKTTILMFDDGASSTPADPKLEAVFSGAQIIEGASVGANKTLTIVPPAGSSGLKTFRFIANTHTATAAAATLALPATIGQTWSTLLPLLVTDGHTTPGLLPKQDLLMYGSTPTAINIKTVQNAGKITMKRRVARFDIQNDKNALNGVEIDRVIVNNVVEKGFVLPSNSGDVNPAATTNSLTLVAGTDFNATEANDLVAHPKGAESAFYLYPFSATITTIQIIDKSGKVYNVSARNIVANTRYVLKVKVSDGNVGFELEAAPWDDATTDAIAEAGAPAISGFALGTASDGDLNPTALSYNMTGTQAGTIKFSTTSATSAGSTVSIVQELGDFGGVVSVSAPNPLVPTLTYAAGYVQTYTITIPAFTSSTTDIAYRIVVSDKAAGGDAPKTTISLYSPAVTLSNFYPGTSFEPVVFDGVTWAPVNVGASTIAGTLNTSDLGAVFQWGRNIPFKISVNPELITGPLTIEEANATDKFIKSNNWLATTLSLWATDVQGPCPSGWKVPTLTQLSKLITSDASHYKAEKNCYEYTAEDGKILTIPLAGHINNNGVVIPGQAAGDRGYYLSTTTNTTYLSLVHYLFFDKTLAKSDVAQRAAGMSVRCVKI